MNGKAHAAASTFLAVPTGIGVAYATASLALGTCAAVGALSGVILSPDLDQEQRTESEAAVYRMGAIIGFVFQVYWYAYALAIKHRSPWSHWPVLGSLLRALYAAIPVIVAAFYVYGLWGLLWDARQELLAWFIGLCVSDTAHWLMDQI